MQGRHTAHRNTTDFSLCSDSPARAHCSLLDVTSEDTAQNLHNLPSINICMFSQPRPVAGTLCVLCWCPVALLVEYWLPPGGF